jgi:hypothetical protein
MNTSQQEDDLARKAMQTSGEEQLSAGFTSNFMALLREHVNSPQFIYRPVFSKRTWYIIGAIALIALISFMLIPSGPIDPTAATPFGKLQPVLTKIAAIGTFLRTQLTGPGIWLLGFTLIPMLYLTDRYLRKRFKKSSVNVD